VSAQPVAVGLVSTQLAGPDGREVKGSSRRGQLYASAEGLVLLGATRFQRVLDLCAFGCVVASLGLVIANLVLWKRMDVLWVAVGLQGIYMLLLPPRRRLVAPRPLSAADLSARVAAGEAALRIPAADVRGLTDPGPGERGRRTPGRIDLPSGALVLWIDEAAFAEVRRAIGRS
jgi:hypothetical protein